MHMCFSEGSQDYTVVCASWRQGSAKLIYLFSVLSLSGQHDFIQGRINGLLIESQCIFSKATVWETPDISEKPWK